MKSKFTSIKKIVQNNTNVIENYFFMTAIQIINTFFGILIYPYLIRVLGASSYGLFVYSQSIISYFTVIVAFGFSFPALKIISKNRDNQKVKNDVINIILTAKLILASFSIIAFIVLIYTIPIFFNNKLLFLINFTQIIQTIFYPQWYFQAIQKMKITTYIQLSFRILSLPFIFLLIHTPDDILIYALLVSTINILSTITSLVYLYKKENIRYRIVKISALKKYILDALPFFWSTSTGVIKGESVAIIIGSLFGMKEVAYYNLAEKIISIPRMVTMNINDALFPRMILNNNINNIKRIIKFETWIGLAVIATIILLGKYIIILLGGELMISAYPMAIILSITVLVWLVVGSYINFVFVPAHKYYLVTKNQFVAFISFFTFCILGLLIYKNILIVTIALSLSGIFEIFYCRYLIKKYELL